MICRILYFVFSLSTEFRTVFKIHMLSEKSLSHSLGLLINLQTRGIEPRGLEGRKKCMIYLRGSWRDGSVGYSMHCFSRGHSSVFSTCVVAENQVWRSDTFFWPQQASSTKTEDMNIDRYMVQDINSRKKKF